MHAPRVTTPRGRAALAGFVRTRWRDLRCVIREDLYRQGTEQRWEARVRELFSPDCPGQIIKRGTYKTLLKTALGDTVCLVKKYRMPGLRRRLTSLFRPSRAAREFAAGQYIGAQGIATAVPLLLAERVRWGLVGEGLIAMPFLEDAQELRDFLFAPDVPARERREILGAFGALTGEIFSRAVFQYDYALNNFLIRRECSGWRLYFIDFEKVQCGVRASRRRKLDVLSRLNRAGRPIGVRDRLLFVRGYLTADPSIAPDSRTCARELCRQTVATLRADLKRRRLTSIYTHARYRRIAHGRCTGLCKHEYLPEDIVALLQDAPPGARVLRHVPLRGTAPPVAVIGLAADDAETLWAAMNALVVAGADFGLPEFFIRDDRRGCVGFDPEGLDRCRRFLTTPSPCLRFVQRAFPRETGRVRSLCTGQEP